MNKAEDRLIDEIFSGALALPRGERERFVRQRCADNPDMEKRVRTLLAASQTPDDELSGPFDSARESLWRDVLGDDDVEDLSGKRIDGWRILRRLARGGLATVYLAAREGGTFEQKTAFKVLRRGLDTDDVVARFRAERQILSTLEHPSIARILDGGALDDGRPYLVLEFVDGLPITRYCEDNGLNIPDRARLLMDVLEALHQAHRHLIVHRDIKPSNILVTAEGRVSLLDFGISKLLDPEAMPGAATLTRTGISLLTPGYGSPEQHAGQPITTASDIYQVGLVAYQMVTGKRPFDGSRKPGDAAAIPPSRAMDQNAEQRKVAGDLDAIICKALHDEANRRYGSALDMRDDLQRYLDHRPVLARPDSLGYRAVKLARRRPWLVPLVVLGFLAVAGYMTTITLYSRQLEFEKRRALAAETFMVDLLESPDPFAPADPERGSSITVVEALDLGVERLRDEVVTDLALRATLMDSIAGVYASLDQTDKAIELGEQGLSLQRGVFGDASAEVLDSLSMLAGQYQIIGDYDKALRYRNEEMMLAQRLHPGTDPRLGAAEANSADLQVLLGNFEEGRRLYEEAIEKLRQTPAESAKPLIDALVALSGLINMVAPGEAAALLSEAEVLAIELFGRQSLSMALIQAQAGSTASNQRRFDESEAALRAALEIYEARLGRAHSATISALNNLAVLLMRKGDLKGAERAFSELLEMSEHKYGSGHSLVAGHYQNLATVIGRQGRFAEALPLHRRAYEIFSDTLPDNPMTAYPQISIAYAELQVPDAAAAERAAREALRLLGTSATNAYAIGVANCLAGLALERQGFAEEGALLLDQARAALTELPVDPVYHSACRL